MTDNRDDLLWLGASLCRAKDRAAAAERRVVDLERAAKALLQECISHKGLPPALDAAAADLFGLILDARKPQDTPEPPTLPDPVPDRPEAPGSIQEAADSLLGYLDTGIRGPEAPSIHVGRLRVKLPDP